MFYELYKKHIQIGIVLLLILGIFGSLFYINNKDARVIDSIRIDVSSGSVKFEDSKLSGTQEKYDYYQVYLYPNIFEITCISGKKEVCDKIEKAKDSLKTNIIGFIGRDLNKGAYGEVELKTYLEGDTIDNKKLKDLFMQLYNNNGFQGLKKLEGEMVKYFNYKIEENSKEEVMVNNFEMSCFEKIRSTIPLGSFDEENLIKSRVKSECSGFANIKLSQENTNGGTKVADSEIEFGIIITELKAEYKFFKKKGLDFEEKSSQEKLIETNIKSNSKFKESEAILTN